MYNLAEASRDTTQLILASLGISLAVNQYIGGACLAISVSLIFARHGEDNRKRFWVGLTALAVATLGVMITAPFEHFGYAPQLVMAVFGGLSGWLVAIVIAIMSSVEGQSEGIAGKLLNHFLNGQGK